MQSAACLCYVRIFRLCSVRIFGKKILDLCYLQIFINAACSTGMHARVHARARASESVIEQGSENGKEERGREEDREEA